MSRKNDNNKSMKKQLALYVLAVALVFGFSAQVSAKVVTVQKGDSLYKIAKRYNVSFSEVLNLNKHFDNKHLIYPQDKVYLPDGSTGTGTTTNSEADNIGKGNSTAVETEIPAQAEQVLNLVNAERKKKGLKALTLSNELTNIATLKSSDMAKKNYFSHTSPTYGTPFEMLQQFGISYSSAGENIAAGQKTADDVMQSWLNSSGHRANILSSKYTELGVGYYKGGSYGVYWTQLFTGK